MGTEKLEREGKLLRREGTEEILREEALPRREGSKENVRVVKQQGR